MRLVAQSFMITTRDGDYYAVILNYCMWMRTVIKPFIIAMYGRTPNHEGSMAVNSEIVDPRTSITYYFGIKRSST